MLLKFHKAILHDLAYYQDERGNRYRRIVGGIGWPHSGEPGFAIVVAESEDESAFYTVLEAWENHNAYKLLDACKAAEAQYPVPAWHTNVYDRTMVSLLYEFNKGKESFQKLTVKGTPQSGEVRNSGYYLPLLIEMVQPGSKRLSAGASPKLLNAINTLDPERQLNKDIAEFPTLAALCYPMAYLLTYSGRMVRPRKPDLKQYEGLGWQL